MFWVVFVLFLEICIFLLYILWKMMFVYWMFFCIFCIVVRKFINKKSFIIVVFYGLYIKCLLNLYLFIISKFKI